MEPLTPADRARWLELTVEGLSHEVISIRVQLRALVMRPPALGGADQALADLLHRQLELMERQCALVRTEAARLRAELMDAPPPEAGRAPPPEEPPPEREGPEALARPDEPEEP